MPLSMEKTQASRNMSPPRRREYPYHDVHAPLKTPMPEQNNTDPSSSSMKADVVTHDISPMSGQSSALVFARNPSGWHMQFFIRVDVGGSFHTYPSLGGPFQSLQEAENAITSHLNDLRSPIMCTDGLSDAEIGIRHALYWLDGTRKKSSKGNPDHRNISLLVQALLDKYNEDRHLFGDLAYELDAVVIFREFYMGEMGCLNMYYHLNLTTKTKGADDFHGGINNLFFAEVAQIEGENDEYVLNCFHMVKPNDNGRCYGCMSYGNVDLKHPVSAVKYEGRRSRPFKLSCGVIPERDVGHGAPAHIQNEDDRLADEEAEIRRIYKCPDEPPVLTKSDGARISAGLGKRDNATVAKREDAGLAKRDDGQGSGKYIVPARRRLV